MYDELLSNVGADVIESLALMFLIPPEDAEDIPTEPKTTVSVSFSGPVEGVLLLHITEQALQELASNMLGMDSQQPPTPEHELDAIKELGNVVCGNILPEIAGKKAICHVDAPVLLECQANEQTAQELKPKGSAKLFFDNGQLELELYISQQEQVCLVSES